MVKIFKVGESFGNIKIPEDKRKYAEQTKEAINQDEYIQTFITDNQIPQALIERDYSRLNEYYINREGDGYTKPQLIFTNGFIQVTYIQLENENAKRADAGVNTNLVYDDNTNKFKGLTFDDVEIDKQNALIVKAFKRLVADYSFPTDKSGVWLHGKFGRGKSYIMGAVATELHAKGAGVTYISVQSLLDGLYRAMDFKINNISQQIHNVKTAEVLIFDDIGAENAKDYGIKQVLYHILDYRYDNGLLTMFTSNLTQQEYTTFIKQKISNPLDAERLLERIEVLSKETLISGDNRRIKA